MKAVNLHKRFALATLKVFGTKPIGILCGFWNSSLFAELVHEQYWYDGFADPNSRWSN